jgi:DNA-binding SARP family transcriptional activator
VEFRILGTLDASVGLGSVDLGGRRQQLVLAVLLDHANETVGTDELIDAVWGEAPPPTARKTLQVYVSRLRHVLHEGTIVARGDGYRLQVAPEQVDAHRFEQALADARAALEGDPATAARRLREALALWQGAPWGPLGDAAALQPSRRRLQDRWLEAVEARVAADLACGAVAGLPGELDSLIADHPLREPLYRLRMLALYGQGRQAEALATFQRLRETLADELGIDPSPELARLHEQILRQDPVLAAPGSTAPTEGERGTVRNPYKGLQAFGEEDAADFFGREPVVRALLARLPSEPFLAVVGPSGSGKSSIVRAGVLPAVRRGEVQAGTGRWLVATMVPGGHPFEALEAALLRAAPAAPASLQEQFRGDDLDLLRAVLRVLPDETTRLLLVVDQFEELYTLTQVDDERRRFARNLVEAVEDPEVRLTVLVTLRADLFDRPLDDPGLAGPLVAGLVSVPPLTPSQLEAAAVQPAAGVGVSVDPQLAAELISAVANQPGALPLFEYALTQAFDVRRGATLSLDTYRRLGGLRGALARRSDEVYAGLAVPVQRAAQQVFLRLVTLGEGTEDTRRRVHRAELTALDVDPGAVDVVLQRFGDARLLSLDRDPVSGEPTVEVAHEALLRAWPRLRAWIDDARHDLRLHRTMAAATAEWAAAGRDDDYLLAGSRLTVFDAWSRETAVVLTATERAFLQASQARRDRTAAEEARRQRQEVELEQRARGRLRTLVLVLAAAVVVASGLTVYAVSQAVSARQARDDAVAASTMMRVRELTATAVAQRQSDPALSLRLLEHAVALADEAGEPVPADTVAALHWVLQAARVPYPAGDAEAVVLSGPAGPQGVFRHELPVLLDLARASSRELSPAECLAQLGEDCPTLPASTPSDLQAEQVGGVVPEDAPSPALVGTTVRLLDAGFDDTFLRPELDALETRTGIELRVDQETNFENVLEARVLAGEVDLALVPQPGAVAAMARAGVLVRLSGYLDAEELRRTLSPSLVALGSLDADGTWPAVDGEIYGVPVDLNLKGMVWYPVPVFAAAGYEVPTTLDELTALTDQLLADGRTPWCHGEWADTASGWPGTDVIEDLLLHGEGFGTYDRWVAGEVAFQDPVVRRAFERFDALVLADDRVAGGRRMAASAPPAVTLQSLFDDPPTCWLAHGASFTTTWFPFGTLPGPDGDADWFAFPDAGAGEELALGAGDYVVAFTDRPEVREVVRELIGTEWGRELADEGAWYFPANRTFPTDAFTDDGARAVAVELYDALAADAFRYDGSDLMPQAVNEAFWAGMVRFVGDGPDNLDEVLADIDAAWATVGVSDDDAEP